MKKFNLYFALLSIVVDLSAIFIGLVIAYQLRASERELYLWPFSDYLSFVVWFLPLWFVLLASQGLYSPRTLPKGWNAAAKVLIALLSGWGAILIVLYLSRSPEALVFPRLVIAYGLIWTFALTLLGRLLVGKLMKALNRAGVGTTQTVIVGKGGQRFINELEDLAHGRKVIAIIRENFVSKLEELLTQRKIEEVIVADPDMPEKTTFELLQWAESHSITFAQVPSLLSVRATNVEIGTLAGTPVMYFKRTPLEGWGRVYKRLLDLVIVLPAIIILSPIMVLLAIFVRLSSPGPVIFRHTRVGQDGRPFYVHKFRSMYVDADERHREFRGWSADERTDPRITPVGRVLRRSNLDELPQLWDVLLGTMSLVGPRPEQPKYVKEFSQEIPNYMKRHHVKSGLTGWAQVNGLRGDTSVTERIKYDLYYIENWSLWFDLRILVATFIFIFKQIMGRA